MGSIITTYSSVVSYINSTSGEYSSILTRANEIRSRVEKLYYEVQMDLESISRQIMRGQRMLDEIQLKVDKYQALMEDAAAEVDRCDAEISYVLNHPITRTYTDEDGNSYSVEEIDEAALAAAERARDRAVAEYERYREKYDEANAVKSEVSSTVSRFETIKSAIEKIAQMIQSDIYEIQKFISAIENESEYNLRNLTNVSNSLSAYLASKAINMPVGTVYSDYSAGGSFSGSANSSVSAGEAFAEVAATSDNASSATVGGSSYESIDKAKVVSERYFNKQSKRDAKGLSFKERRSIETFCNESTFPPEYDKMNGFLRNGGELPDYLKDTINTMTDTISKHALPRDMVLYRGMGNAEKILGDISGKSIEEINSSCQGKTFIERGFSSTSVLEGDAMKYVKYKGALLEIKAPSGAEGIFTGEISRFRDTEHEVTLQRGSVYTIDSVVDCGDYYKVNLNLTARLNYEQ